MATKWMYTNYLNTARMENVLVSSEDSSFPDDNLYDNERRTKVWRSQGYWNITSSNQQIVFQETDGTDLTAYIAIDEYNSTSSLLAAIQTALDAVGASTYTLAVDASTHKIKFTSNGSGGGGIFKLRWTQMTALAALLGFDSAADDTGALTYTADVLRIHGSEWLTWDFGLPTNPKAFIAIGSRNTALKLSPGATIKLQGSMTNSWASPAYDQTLTYNDEMIYQLADSTDAGLHTEGLRYWRFYIEDKTNPNNYVELGSLYLGDVYELTRGAVFFPLPVAFESFTRQITTEGGQVFSVRKPKTQKMNLDVSAMTTAEKETMEDLFEQVGLHTPFFISIDPNAYNSSSGKIYLKYVRFETEPRYQLSSPGFYSMDVDLREEL